MHVQDLYVRLTDMSGTHKPVINYHRVWDAQRFLAAQTKQHSEAKNPADRRVVSVVTADDYKAFRRQK